MSSSLLFLKKFNSNLLFVFCIYFFIFPIIGSAHSVPLITLPDFSKIVERTEQAVVNIRTTTTITNGNSFRGSQPGLNDPYDLFRFFFGPDFQFPNVENNRNPGNIIPKSFFPENRVVPRGLGSGFFISQDGYILTNNHVISDAKDIFVTLADRREFKAKLIGRDERTDIALLKIDISNATSLTIGNIKNLKKGHWVLAIGSPFGLDSTVTAGIVSAIGRDTGEYLPFIQTDVAVNPGNSGGPLINLQGEVVGINSQIVSPNGGFMGIALAIPIDEAMRVQNQLRKHGKVIRGFIGVQISELKPEVAKLIGLNKTKGALVSSVQPGSPADNAKIQPGDIILSFDGKEIVRWNDLPRLVGSTPPGSVKKIDVWRKGKKFTTSMKVEEIVIKNLINSRINNGIENLLGINVIEVPNDIQKKLRIKGGLYVKQINSIGLELGISPGDILLAVNDVDIVDMKQFLKVLKKFIKLNKPVILLIRRGENTMWIPIFLK